jgi:hypothetical protein
MTRHAMPELGGSDRQAVERVSRGDNGVSAASRAPSGAIVSWSWSEPTG